MVNNLTFGYLHCNLVGLPKEPYTRRLQRLVVTLHFSCNVAHRAIQSLWWRVWVLQVVKQAVGADYYVSVQIEKGHANDKSRDLNNLCAIALAIVVLATLWRRGIKAAWEGPQPQVLNVRVPTDDPINDRFEIYFSKEKES